MAISDAQLNPLSHRIIAACIEVHRHLGPGLLESVYERCVSHELSTQGIQCSRQVRVPVTYKNLAIEAHYRIDLLVEGAIVLEAKAVETLLPIHSAQALTYLRMARLPLALVVNFKAPTLRGQIRRLSHGAPDLRSATSERGGDPD